jgi:hypothetical protein
MNKNIWIPITNINCYNVIRDILFESNNEILISKINIYKKFFKKWKLNYYIEFSKTNLIDKYIFIVNTFDNFIILLNGYLNEKNNLYEIQKKCNNYFDKLLEFIEDKDGIVCQFVNKFIKEFTQK